MYLFFPPHEVSLDFSSNFPTPFSVSFHKYNLLLNYDKYYGKTKLF